VNYRILRAPAAEFVGTALFVLVGAGSAIANQGGAAGLAIALANGIGLALWLGNKIDALTLGRYVLAQLLGAIVGALLIKATFPASAVRMSSLGTPQVAGSMSLIGAIALEALFTFFLVSAVYGTVVSPQGEKVAGFGIGLVVVVCALGGGGALTGAVMNPARAFGPALVSWDWHAQAVYWIGPLVGAAAAAGLWRYLLLPPGVTDLR